MLAVVLGWLLSGTISLQAQSSVKEYIHLGGRVIAIENSTMSISPTSLGAGYIGLAYSATLSVTGGIAPYSWSLDPSSAPLPPGLALQSAGATPTLSGTPTTQGTFAFTVAVTDSSTPQFRAIQAYSVTISPPANNNITVTTIPAGYSLTVDTVPCTSPCSFSWVPGLPHTIVAPSPQSGGTGIQYRWGHWTDSAGGTYTGYPSTLNVSAPSSAITYTANLDTWYYLTTVVFPSNEGTITPASEWVLAGTGVPLTATGGSGYVFTGFSAVPSLTFTQNPNPSQTVTMNSAETVTANFNTPVGIGGPGSLPSAQTGVAYSFTMSATGGQGPYTWSFVGLPSGLSGSTAGVISGTATTAGAYSVAATVTDSIPSSVAKAYVLTVAGTLTPSYSGSMGTFPLGYPSFSMQMYATGGIYPYTWTSTDLPAWLTLSSSGALVSGSISGSTGQVNLHISVADSGTSQQIVSSIPYWITVTAGGLCQSLAGSPGVYAGQSVTSNLKDCNTGLATNGNWNASGRGTLAPTLNSSSTVYTAPAAVFPGETDSINVASSTLAASSGLELLLLPPPPTLTPSSSMVTANQFSFYTVSGSQADGWNSTNDYLYVDFDGSGTYQSANSCFLWYQPSTRSLFLASDNGSSYTSGMLGATQTLSNSQCLVNLNTTTASVNGAILTLNIPVAFTAGYPGQKTIFAQAYPDTDGLYFTVGSVTSQSLPPSLSSLSPNSGSAGNTITIAGSHFGVNQWQSAVTFNGVAAVASSWSDSSIAVAVPANASSGNVVVTVGGVASNGLNFTFVPTPSISSLSPVAGPVGTPVTITGANFGGSGTVKFGSLQASVTNWTNTSISASVPSGASTGNVTVTVGTLSSNGVTFTISSTVVMTYSTQGTSTWTAPASVTSVTVQCWGPGGNGGNGTTTSYSGGGGGGGGAYAVRNSATVVPGNSYTIVVGGGGSTTQTTFGSGVCAADYGQVGYINMFPSPGGSGGQASNSSGDSTSSGSTGGTGGAPYGGSGGSGANGGSGGARGFCSSPATPGGSPGGGGAGGCNQGAYTAGGTGAVGQVTLTYTPPAPVIPAINGMSPGSGPIGTLLTISGSNFGSSQASSTITMNGTNIGAATTWSPTGITIRVPGSAPSGNVVVSVGGQTSNGVSFAVTGFAPLSGYSYQRAITISHAKVPNTDQLSFPVVISGTYSYLANVASLGHVQTASGYDIVFSSDAAGVTQLNFERTMYVSSTGQVEFWVRIPTLSHTTDTTIYMWYGNPSTTYDTATSRLVWDSNYQIAYHLADSANNTTVLDSTSNGFNGTAQANTSGKSGTGEVGKGLSFNGSSDYIQAGTGSKSLTAPFTIEEWFNTNNIGAINGFFGSRAPNDYSFDAKLSSPTQIRGEIGSGTTWLNTSASATVTAVAASTWYHVAYVVTPSGYTIYQNGAQVGSGALSGTALLYDSNHILRVGADGPFEYFNGSLDEFRLSASARSADWLATEANNQTSPSGFYSMGSELAPGIASLSQYSGAIGTPITITGNTFGSTQGSASVTFHGTAATVTSWSPTSITTTVPYPATSGNVVVTVGGVASNGVNFTVTNGTATSIWPSNAVPSNPFHSDSPTVTGVKFRSDVGGIITGLRFYKGSGNNGTHIGLLYSIGGTLLGQATFTGETASGWQQVNLTMPVAIAANTTYVAAYFSTTGFALNASYFTSAGVDNAPLHALKSGLDGLNGVYAYSSSPVFPSNSAGDTNYWADVVFAPTTISTIWPATAVPGTPFQGDSPATLGVKFRSDVAGSVTGVRFYKGAGNTGTHIGLLYSASGSLLAQATYTNETASGWQQVNFFPPVSIAANITYVAAYFSTTGLAHDYPFFTSSGADNPPLHALRSGVDGLNGVYVYGASAAFPSNSWSDSNYWADLVLSWQPTPSISSLSTTSGAAGNPVTVTGSNFGAAQGSSSVTFNGAPATVTGWSPTSIAVTVPAGASSGNLVVTVSGVPSNGVPFTVLATPSITGVSPASGLTGASVIVTGTSFGSSQGSSTVKFNGVAATTVISWNSTTISVLVPNGATTGNVVVTAGGLASNGVAFTVTGQGLTNGYSYKRAITISHARVSNSDQSNFPALVSDTYSYLANVSNGGKVQSASGYDIVFSSDIGGNALLPFERERYVSTTGEVAYWVKMPTLSHSTDTTIYLWYGNSSVTTDLATPTQVWDSNYKGVWHLANGATLTPSDSTSNGNNGTAYNGATAGVGRIGGAGVFNGTNSFVDLGAGATLRPASAVTASGWIKASATETTFPQIVSEGDSTGATGFNLYLKSQGYPGLIVREGANSWGSCYVGGPTMLNDNAWHHVTGVYSGGAVSIFVDGVPQGTSTCVNQSINYGSSPRGEIGWKLDSGSNDDFNGVIDEVRVSNSVRSADWIATEYNNQSSPSSFYTVGPEMTP